MLDQFYGNEKAKQTLVFGWKDGRLPHAVLLEGESGCGKKTFARIIAMAAVCIGAEQPCGVCGPCLKAAKGAHPDILLVDGAASAKSLNVDAVREIRLAASVKPNEADRKVYILADAQNMTVQAQNALLKVLEEPPRGVTFILTCENRSLLLETIVSRVTLLRLENPLIEQCAAALASLDPGRTEEEYRLAAQVYEGNIGRAAASLRDEGFIKVVESARKIAEAAARGTEYDLLAELAVFEGDKDSFKACLRRVKVLLMDCLRRKCGASAQQEGRLVLDNYLSALQCRRIIDIIEEALRMMDQNMGYPLASVWLCARVKAALEG